MTDGNFNPEIEIDTSTTTASGDPRPVYDPGVGTAAGRNRLRSGPPPGFERGMGMEPGGGMGAEPQPTQPSIPAPGRGLTPPGRVGGGQIGGGDIRQTLRAQAALQLQQLQRNAQAQMDRQSEREFEQLVDIAERGFKKGFEDALPPWVKVTWK